MVRLTPGLRFLASGAIYGSIPFIGGLVVKHLLDKAFDAHIHMWLVIVASLSAFPVGAIIRLSLKEWKDRHDAATMGAQIVPKVTGKWLGNLDVLQKVKEVWASGYPGMCSLTTFWFANQSMNLRLLCCYLQVITLRTCSFLMVQCST